VRLECSRANRFDLRIVRSTVMITLGQGNVQGIVHGHNTGLGNLWAAQNHAEPSRGSFDARKVELAAGGVS
jgi:hypothetical protein